MRAFGIVLLFLFMISTQAVSLAGAPDPEDLKKLKILSLGRASTSNESNPAQDSIHVLLNWILQDKLAFP